jgi:hypothetical protein
LLERVTNINAAIPKNKAIMGLLFKNNKITIAIREKYVYTLFTYGANSYGVGTLLIKYKIISTTKIISLTVIFFKFLKFVDILLEEFIIV